MKRLLLFPALLLADTGCSESPTRIDGEPVEDAAPAPPIPLGLEPGFFTAEGEPMHLIADGDVVPVRLAAQGGYAMFVGARITGLPERTIRLAAALVDPTTGEPLVSDSRAIRLMPARAAGLEPDPQSNSNFLHLVACPNYGKRFVHGLPWRLEIRVDDERYTGETSVNIVPKCAPGSRFLRCVCECEPGYVMAKCGALH